MCWHWIIESFVSKAVVVVVVVVVVAGVYSHRPVLWKWCQVPACEERP